MKRIAAVFVALALGSTYAQALATPGETDPSLIFALLGTAKTLGIQVPEDVEHLFVHVMYQGESVLSDDRPVTERNGAMPHAVVTAGAMSDANGCPLLLFAGTALEEQGQPFASGHSTYCLVLEGSPSVRRAPLSAPWVFERPVELPLDTWLAFEAARVDVPGQTFDPDDPSQAIVFYLHLSTEEAGTDPETPSFETWHEIGRSSY